MNRIALGILFAPLGFIVGAWILTANLDPPAHRSDFDSKSLGGVLLALFIGGPIGIALFSLLGVWIGSLIDRRVSDQFQKSNSRTIVVPTAIGAIIGMVLYGFSGFRSSPSVYLVGLSGIGLLVGYIRYITKMIRSRE